MNRHRARIPELRRQIVSEDQLVVGRSEIAEAGESRAMQFFQK
jgi:hypothetical protein